MAWRRPAFGRGQASRSAAWARRLSWAAAANYQIVAKAGKKAGVAVYPHRFRHHFSHTWLDRGGAGGDLMELNGWTSPQMLAWYGGSARARRNYDRIMNS